MELITIQGTGAAAALGPRRSTWLHVSHTLTCRKEDYSDMLIVCLGIVHIVCMIIMSWGGSWKVA